MFYREALEKLKVWSNKKDRKPLIIRGARQVGKTTLIDMFSTEFDQYIYLDLEKRSERDIFERNDNIDRIVETIFVLKNKSSSNSNTLIFIDEIQNSGNAIKMLRYFYEEYSEYSVIAAGSLLELATNYKISFPVGRVEYLYMYPFTYTEFLNASEETGLLGILGEIPFPNYAHNKALKLFRDYTLLGGMPDVISNYLTNKDFVGLKSIYESLLDSYIDDIEKYAANDSQMHVIRFIINNSFRQAGKRITFEGFAKSTFKNREIREAMYSLEKAMLIRLLYPSVDVNIPVVPDIRKSPKLMLLDTGLINYFAGIQKQFFSTNQLNDVYHGLISEHIVWQELLANSKSQFHLPTFWVREKRQSTAEVDYLFQFEGLVIPVEVKSGKVGRLRSLMQFVDMATHNYAVRIYSGELSIDKAKTIKGKKFKLLNLPFYLAGNLEKYLEWFIHK